MAATFHPEVMRGGGSTSDRQRSVDHGDGRTWRSISSGSGTATSTTSTSSHPSRLPSLSPSNSSSRDSAYTGNGNPSSSSSTSLPIHGIQLDPSNYPLHPYFTSSSSSSSSKSASSNSSSNNDDPTSNCGTIRLITANQYTELLKQNQSIKLENENILFPWLHGADIPYSAQAENFGFRNGNFKECPR